MSEDSGRPPAPELPEYLREPLERQSPERLEAVAAYAADLAAWKRRRREAEFDRRRSEEAVGEDAIEELAERGVPTDPGGYDDVPDGAYVTVKETKPGYRYYYWQWREGDTWNNEYIAPVEPKRES